MNGIIVVAAEAAAAAAACVSMLNAVSFLGQKVVCSVKPKDTRAVKSVIDNVQ